MQQFCLGINVLRAKMSQMTKWGQQLDKVINGNDASMCIYLAWLIIQYFKIHWSIQIQIYINMATYTGFHSVG